MQLFAVRSSHVKTHVDGTKRCGSFFNDFQESNTAAIGWMDVGDVKPGEAKDKLLARMSTGKGVADVEE